MRVKKCKKIDIKLKHNYEQGEGESFQNMILHRRKHACTGRQRPTPDDKGSRFRHSLVVPSTASRHYDNLYRKNSLTDALRIKLMDVFYVSWIW
jgi:hypothetical protein